MTREERIVAEARSWVGTPYQHQCSTKGAGTDCLGLVRGVWRAMLGPEPEVVPPYTADWAEPGGTDFAAAQRLGCKAIHALSLPAACAPDTAGEAVARTVLTILQEREEHT